MRNPGAFCGVAALAVVSLSACFGKMYVPAPSATYDVVEGWTPALTAREQELVDQVNARLVAEGFPAAKVGVFETKLALLEAEIVDQKAWSTSAHRFDVSFVPDPDEEETTDVTKLHVKHWLLAHGVAVPAGVFGGVQSNDFPKRRLQGEDLDTLWPTLRPGWKPEGELKIGVAIVPDGLDDKRYFAVILRDDQLDLSEGPPRTAEPGSTFEIRGQFRVQERPLQLAVLHPDGKVVDLQEIDVQSDGGFTASYQLPKEPGRYVVAIGPGWAMINVPVFAGVGVAPWPPYAAADATDPSTARDAAKEFATAVQGWRKGQNLPSLPLPAELCTFAKTEARRHAANEPLEGLADRLRAAGLDPATSHVFSYRAALSPADETNLQHSWETFMQRAPWDPFWAAVLGSPSLGQLAIGVVPEPQKSTDDQEFVDLVWIGVETPASGAPSAPRASR